MLAKPWSDGTSAREVRSLRRLSRAVAQLGLPRPLSLIAITGLSACLTDTWEPTAPPPITAGAPKVGAAEGFLELPLGTPLSGYTTRCTCLGGLSRTDFRESAYNKAFVESVGIQSQPQIKVVWVEAGDDHLAITKTDSIYSYDGLVDALEIALSDATGLDMAGRVVHTANHSHASYGAYSDQITFYLGSDRYNEEIFRSFVSQVSEVAIQAFETREPAKIGYSRTKDWDPDNRVYRDRRPENNALVLWEDQDTPGLGKDPYLQLLRFDKLSGDPLAVIVNWGMHGTLLDTDSPMVSSESGGHAEAVLQDYFDDPVVVMYTQGAGGDVSAAGSDRSYAKLESIGEWAKDAVLDAWAKTPTSDAPMKLETVSRSFDQHQTNIRVTRGGAVDWSYRPYEEGYVPDDIIYDDDGEIQSPLDEFNTAFGGVFCGTGDLAFPIGQLASRVEPYSNCLEVELLSNLIKVFFELDEVPLPLPESLKAGTTASRLGPVATRGDDGTIGDSDILLGFFPGEVTYGYNEMFRRRAKAELGYEYAMGFGYSQDHEGYLLVVEDWMLGGYEPDIGLWGPLQGEAILDGVINAAAEVLATDVREDPDPFGQYQRTIYEMKPLPTAQPDVTPDAGTRLLAPPEYWWLPLDFDADLAIPEQLPRVQGTVQIAWLGGDPGVDKPQISVERLVNDAWEPLRSHNGRLISEAFHDILVTYTPDPLFPHTALQKHIWWAQWQAVNHVRDRAGLPLGTYRLKVNGDHYTGGATVWPWPSEPYELTSEPFELVPATLTISHDAGQLGVTLRGPDKGYRLIALNGDSRGNNPAVGPFSVTQRLADGTITTTADVPATGASGGVSSLDFSVDPNAEEVNVSDAYGNVGTWFANP